MNKRSFAVVAVGMVALLFTSSYAISENLFEEAGHSLSRSRWVSVRLLPSIDIALESDDVVLVESVDHAPKGLAMKIDGEAIAADCEVTESKDQSYSYTTGQEKQKDDDKKLVTSTTTNISHTTYYSSCQFAAGTTLRATQAHAIIVQVAMPQGTTKPHQLSSKALRKFQLLNK